MANGMKYQKQALKSTMADFSLPLKRIDKTMGVSLFQVPVYTEDERRIEMVREVMKRVNNSTPLSPPCSALSFHPDDGSLVSTLTTSTTRSSPNVRDKDEIFERKVNEVDPATLPHGSAPKRKRQFPTLPFEEVMDMVFFRVIDALLGDEAMMTACQDPIIGRPILDDFFSTNGGLAGLIVPQKDDDLIVTEFDKDHSGQTSHQNLAIPLEADHQASTSTRSIPVVPEPEVRDTKSSSWHLRSFLLDSFQFSSLPIDGYSPSFNLGWENDASSINRDDSLETKKSWSLVHEAASETFHTPSRNEGLPTHHDRNDVRPSETKHDGAVSYPTTEFDPALKKQELIITLPHENSEEDPQVGSYDDLVLIKHHDFEAEIEDMLQFRRPEEEIVFESDEEEFRVEETETQQLSNKKSTSKRPLGLRFLFGPRLRRRLSSFSWSKKRMQHGVQNPTKPKTKDDPSHSQSSPGTVATTAFTIPSDTDTIQDFSLPASARPLGEYDEQDSCSYQKDNPHSSQPEVIITIL